MKRCPILASASQTRRKMLEELGLSVEIIPSAVDESSLKQRYGKEPPEQLAKLLAEHKAKAISAAHADRLIIASDQLALIEEKQLTKPHDLTDALNTLMQLSGKTHVLVTATCIYLNEQCVWSAVNTASMTMKALSQPELESYLQMDRPLGSVGAYYYEQNGESLFQQVRGEHEVILGFHASQVAHYIEEQSHVS